MPDMCVAEKASIRMRAAFVLLQAKRGKNSVGVPAESWWVGADTCRTLGECHRMPHAAIGTGVRVFALGKEIDSLQMRVFEDFMHLIEPHRRYIRIIE